MKTVNIHEAKTHLSWLVDEAANGEPFIIAKAGKPMVIVTSLSGQPEKKIQRLDFLKGEQFVVPDNFDAFARDEIEQMFGGKERKFSLDTHLLLWASHSSGRLPSRAHALIADATNESCNIPAP